MVGRRCSIGEKEKNLFREKPPPLISTFSFRSRSWRREVPSIISSVLLANETERSKFPTVASRSLPTCAFLLPSFLSCFGHDLLSPPIVLFFLFFLFHSPLHCSDYSDDKYRRGAARPKLRSPQLPAPSRVLIFRGDNEDPRAHSFESSFSFIKFSLAESRGTPPRFCSAGTRNSCAATKS